MLRFEGRLELCELSEEEVRAIAEQEQIPGIVPLELHDYLIRGPDGELLVSHMFIDDIRAAERRGDLVHAAHLKHALRHFIEATPRKAQPWLTENWTIPRGEARDLRLLGAGTQRSRVHLTRMKYVSSS